MRLRLLSRGSDLARLQAQMVERALLANTPDLVVERATRSSVGDRDRRVDLWQSPDKGLFTSDLSEALLAGQADMVVHSWKDLPAAGTPGTMVAGTLERADPRDVLLVRADAWAARVSNLEVLTSSPRRGWQLQQSLAPLLPWSVSAIHPRPVRGNIPTRLDLLTEGPAHALVVAKAALDRLVSDEAPADVRDRVRAAVGRHRWMVLPVSAFPTAPAQGALAIEVAAGRTVLIDLARAISHEPTRRAVEAERAILSGHGGGCHEAIGATVLVRDYGVVTSVRGRTGSGQQFERWSLEAATTAPPAASPAAIWPRPDERDSARRTSLDVALPADDRGWWVARAEAMPAGVVPDMARIVWTAGPRTWHRLAARGVWVHGCADGLGDAEAPAIDGLAGRRVAWHRLTHAGSGVPDAIATYAVETALPADLSARTHFFWSSGSLFLRALTAFPELRRAWHGCGPGRTARTLLSTIDDRSRVSIWLDYDQWHRHVNPQ